MNQRSTHTHEYTTSISQWFESTIYQVNNFSSPSWSLVQEKRNFCTLAHTQNTQNNRSIYLFGMFSKQSHSIATFIYKIEWGKEGKKIEREHSKKLVCTSFVIDDEESNHVNLAFCCTLSLFYYSISIFLAHTAQQRVEERRRRKKHNDNEQVRCDKLFYELEQTEVWFEMAVSYAIKLSLDESLSLKWNFKGISHFFPSLQNEKVWEARVMEYDEFLPRVAMRPNVCISIAFYLFM